MEKKNRDVPLNSSPVDDCDLHIGEDADIVIESDFSPFPEVGIQEGYYGRMIEEKEDNFYFQPYGQAVSITAHYYNILTDEEHLELTYYSGPIMKTKIFPRDIVASGNVAVLSKAGVDISAFSKHIFCQLMTNQMTNVERKWVHTQLGWHTFYDQNQKECLGYFGIRLITPQSTMNSSYIGDLHLHYQKDRKEWLQMVKNHVLGHVELEFALVLGLSASMVGYLRNYANVGSLFVNLVGKTSTGKTTALNLAISTASVVSKGNGNLTLSWNATKNGIIGFLAGNNGIPVALDEMSEASFTNISDLIFQIADGSDKQRANTDGSVKASSTWSTTVLSTSNVSVYDLCNNHNDALQTRILEFADVNWTSTAKQADAINRITKMNGGFLINLFSKKLFNHSQMDLIKRIEEIRASFPSIPESNATGKITRIDEKLALLLVTAEILRDDVKLKVDVDKLKNFLMEHRLKSLKECMPEEDIAYLYLLDVIMAEPDHFYSSNAERFPHEVWGVYSPHCKKLTVEFIPLRFQEIMTRGGFKNYKRILRRWKERGLLDCDPDRLTRSRPLYQQFATSLVYCVNIVPSYQLHLVHDVKTASAYGYNPLPLNEPKMLRPSSFL